MAAPECGQGHGDPAASLRPCGLPLTHQGIEHVTTLRRRRPDPAERSTAALNGLLRWLYEIDPDGERWTALLFGLPLIYAYGGARAFGYLAGAGGLAVVLVYLTGNIAVIRAFRTEFRDEFSFWRHLLIPATAAAIFLFPLWGILRPPAYTLVNLLPFAALGWLCLGVIVAAVFRARRPATFQTLGRVFMPAEEEDKQLRD